MSSDALWILLRRNFDDDVADVGNQSAAISGHDFDISTSDTILHRR